MSLKGKIKFYGLTDTGLHRDHNEDTIGSNEDIALAVLADGMGGHRCGEIASAISVNTILEFTKKKIKQLTVNDIDKNTGTNIHSMVIRDAIRLANENVYNSAQSNKQYHGMGTTIVVALFYDNHVTVAHVGDSRLYRLRDNQLEQITQDHSYIQELLDCGIYNPEQAKNSKYKNLITSAIGIDKTIQVEIQEHSTKIGDIYLLCSDGVSDMIDDELIKSILITNSNDLEIGAAKIIQSANKNGGKDNISALLAKPIKPFPARNNLISRLTNLIINTFSITTLRNNNG